jgi:hypothetical protein
MIYLFTGLGVHTCPSLHLIPGGGVVSGELYFVPHSLHINLFIFYLFLNIRVKPITIPATTKLAAIVPIIKCIIILMF